jgi:hypothetical protein
MTTEDVHLGIRIPRTLLKRVDVHLERMRKEGQSGVKLSRSDAVRNLIALGLDMTEKRPR